MITKKDIEIFNIEVDARIYKLEALKSELELELINNIMEGKDATGVQYQFDNIKAEIKDLKDIKLDANCKYNEQFIGNDLTSIKNYIKSKKQAI